MCTVVETQWLIEMPAMTKVVAAAARKSASRVVPMKALLTLLTSTVSSPRNAASGLNAFTGWPQHSGLVNTIGSWRM